jgi:hypothetical protein
MEKGAGFGYVPGVRGQAEAAERDVDGGQEAAVAGAVVRAEVADVPAVAAPSGGELAAHLENAGGGGRRRQLSGGEDEEERRGGRCHCSRRGREGGTELRFEAPQAATGDSWPPSTDSGESSSSTSHRRGLEEESKAPTRRLLRPDSDEFVFSFKVRWICTREICEPAHILH